MQLGTPSVPQLNRHRAPTPCRNSRRNRHAILQQSRTYHRQGNVKIIGTTAIKKPSNVIAQPDLQLYQIRCGMESSRDCNFFRVPATENRQPNNCSVTVRSRSSLHSKHQTRRTKTCKKPEMILLRASPLLLVVLVLTNLAHALDTFCEKSNNATATTSCPDVATFDIVDIAAYAGLWYEIGSTAQFKLVSEAGLDCLQTRYTPLTADSLAIANHGRRAVGALVALGVTSISSGAKDVCSNARQVCSYLSPGSATMQSVAELRKVAGTVLSLSPDQSAILDEVAENVERFGKNVSDEFTMLAEHVREVQRVDGYLSAGNGSATENVERIRLAVIDVNKHIDVFVEFVREMAAARSVLAQVAVKLVLAGEVVSSIDVTEASTLIAAAEQNILLRAERMKSSLSAMNAASEVLLADPGLMFSNLTWSVPGVATQNTSSKGKLQFFIMGLNEPYWIIGLEGLPSQGYDAALVYSCTENHLMGTIQQGFFVLSRGPTISSATLSRFMAVVESLGLDLDCENPFLTSGCNQAQAPMSI